MTSRDLEIERLHKIARFPVLATEAEITSLAERAIEALLVPPAKPACDECGEPAETNDAIGTPLCHRCKLINDVEEFEP